MKRSKINALMLADLEKSGLDATDAERLCLRPLWSETRGAPAYKIPYFDSDGQRTGHYRMRRVDEEAGNRYWQKKQPEGSKVHIYFPPDFAQADKDLPLYICEGEKKCALLAKLGYRAVALGGVEMFRSKKGDKGLHPALRALASGEVRLAFDGNASVNPDVMRARSELAMRLAKHGADVLLVDIPDPKANLDDWIVEHGKEAFDALPTRPLSVREKIAALRIAKLSARARLEQISAVLLADMQARGLFYRMEDGLLYFDKEGHKPIGVDAPTAVQVRCHLNEVYGINASEREYSFVYEDLRTLAVSHGKAADLRYFAHYGRTECTLYLAASETAMFRITPEGYVLVHNGADDVVLRVPEGMEPVEPSKKAADRSAMDQLLGLPNVVDGEHATADQMRLLYELWIWGVLFGTAALPTRPLVLMHGAKGSAKTAGGRGLLRTLMGKTADVSAFSPGKMDGFDAALTNQHLVVADNIDGGKYHGIEDKLYEQYYKSCLQSLIEGFESTLDVGLALADDMAIELDVEGGLLRLDTAARYASYEVAMRSGWMAPNEVRARENLPPVVGGDSPMIQQQNFSLAALARRDSDSTPATLPAPVKRSPMHVKGEVVVWGSARWLCTGPHKYRPLGPLEVA